MQRRMILSAAAGAVAATLSGISDASAIRERIIPCTPEKPPHVFPRVPTDWWGQGMYEDLLEKGTGIAAPGKAPAGKGSLLICFDTQCPWCHKLFEALKPLNDKVRIVWYPIALLTVWSEPQGALLLTQKDPYTALEEHIRVFRQTDEPRGIKVDPAHVWDIDRKMRNAVWNNSKIFRRNGCRLTPFGVYKNSKGEFVPVYSRMKTEELAKILEVPV